jgi:putative membrane protein (TIGR04086 family)
MNGKSLSDIAPRLGGAPILRGLLTALVFAFISILLTSMIVTWTFVAEARLPTITYLINMLASLVGAFVAARIAGEKGWYYGGITALAYSVTITVIGLFVASVSFTLYNVVQIALMALVGMFGGMIGVNMGAKRKY